VNRPIYIVLGTLVLGVVAYCIYVYRGELGITGPAKTREGAGRDQTTTTPLPAHIDWQLVDRSPDGFRVQMPAGSDETLIPAYNELGGVEQINMITAMPGAETTFAVAWSDHPPVERASNGNAEKILDQARDGTLARTHTVLTANTKTRIDGYPVSEFSARNQQGGVLNERLILAGAHLYMLIAAFPSASAQRNADVNRFFDSFTLTQASGAN
jgi:hypothetical protein